MGIIVNVLEVKGNSDSVATDEQVITDAATSAVPAIIIGDSSIVVIPETTKAEPVHVEENGTAISGAAELATEPANTIEMAMGLNSTTAIITRDFVEETASQATLLPENIPTTTDDDQLIAAAIPDSGKIAPDATPQDLRPHFGPLAAAEVALAEHAKAIRDLRKRVGEDINEIGQRLVECKRLLGHGNWLPWLQQQFGWSVATAERFIAVHKRLGAKIVNLTNLNIGVSSLYLLAAPSTPEDARIEVIERIGDGEPLTNAQVEEIVAEHKKPTRSPSRPPKSKAKKIRRAEPVVIEGMIRTAADNWSLALTQASAKERKDLLGALGQLLDAVGVDDSLKAMSPKYRTDLQGRHDRQQARVQGHLPTPKVETKSLAKRTVEQWANGGIQ